MRQAPTGFLAPKVFEGRGGEEKKTREKTRKKTRKKNFNNSSKKNENYLTNC
jgi:hypothetical protein